MTGFQGKRIAYVCACHNYIRCARAVFLGVFVFTSYALTEDDLVSTFLPPAEVPKKLEEHIFPDLVQKYKRMQLEHNV